MDELYKQQVEQLYKQLQPSIEKLNAAITRNLSQEQMYLVLADTVGKLAVNIAFFSPKDSNIDKKLQARIAPFHTVLMDNMDDTKKNPSLLMVKTIQFTQALFNDHPFLAQKNYPELKVTLQAADKKESKQEKLANLAKQIGEPIWQPLANSISPLSPAGEEINQAELGGIIHAGVSNGRGVKYVHSKDGTNYIEVTDPKIPMRLPVRVNVKFAKDVEFTR